MRHDHTEDIKDEMKKGNKYCKDICNLSLSEIQIIKEFAAKKLQKCFEPEKFRFEQLYNETSEYIKEYSMRLSNRTINFNNEVVNHDEMELEIWDEDISIDKKIKIQLKEIVLGITRLENLVLNGYLKDNMKLENEKIYKKNMKHFIDIGSSKSEIEFAIHKILKNGK